MIECTLVYPIKEGKVLLGLKKRGFRANYWNGFGGKVENETPLACAARELAEECCIQCREEDLEKRADLTFISPDEKEAHVHVEVFFVTAWSGTPQETNEMKPEWFSFDELPFSAMCDDDPHWLPAVLAGEQMKASFHLAKGGAVKEITREQNL